MKLPCAVTRDLLPLYAENMVEQETKVLIEEHLDGCADCRKKLSEMKAPSPSSVDTAGPLQSIKKQIRLRRWYTAVMAALCVLIAAFVYFYHDTSLKPASLEQAKIEVKGVETVSPENRFGRDYIYLPMTDGEPVQPPHEYTGDALVFRIGSESMVSKETEIVTTDDGKRTVIVQGFCTGASVRNDSGKETELVLYPVPDRVIYGYRNPQDVLWGAPMRSGGVEVLPRLALMYYLLFAVISASASGMIWFLLRKRRQSWIPRQIFFAPVSYILAHLLLKGATTTSFFIIRDLVCILAAALAIYGLLSVTWQMFLQRRKEV